MKGETLRSEQDTQALAGRVASLITGGITVGFEGDLGAGKTTFVRHLVEALGGSKGDVASPTFALQYEYQVRSGLTVEHWDLYRLKAAPGELLEPPGIGTVRLIEWPDRCPEILSDIDLLFKMVLLAGNLRSVVASGPLAPRLDV